MAKKSAIFDEYIVQVEDNNHVVVFRIFNNVIESLRDASKSVGYNFDPKWNTRTFGSNLIKEYGEGNSAQVGNFFITKRENGSIETYRAFNDNTKKALRKIAEEVGFDFDPTWTTQQLGNKLVDFKINDINNTKRENKIKKSRNESKTANVAGNTTSTYEVTVYYDETQIRFATEDEDEYFTIMDYIENITINDSNLSEDVIETIKDNSYEESEKFHDDNDIHESRYEESNFDKEEIKIIERIQNKSYIVFEINDVNFDPKELCFIVDTIAFVDEESDFSFEINGFALSIIYKNQIIEHSDWSSREKDSEVMFER